MDAPDTSTAATPKADWPRLSPLLDELLELPAAERRARVAQLAQAEPTLARQLDALLTRLTAIEHDGFLEGRAVDAIAEADAAARPAPHPGQPLGAYTLDSLIGRGGMGAVWLARRNDGRFEGRVAVKFLALAVGSRGAEERFAREGQILARLNHPRIARLLDAGVSADGWPYLVLEHVDGRPIDVHCDDRRLDVPSRVRLFRSVLDAVAHAHSNLVLHRDLKPSNILVDAEGRVKLLDFGIAKLLDGPVADGSAGDVTLQTGRAFTPEYAAPEQVRDEAMTTATDVYALGVLLHRLLCGGHPTARAGVAPRQQLQALLEAEPLRPSDAALQAGDAAAAARSAATPQDLARTLRGDLDNIVVKALKKEPSERYPTAAALAEDLRRFLDHEPVGAHADSFAYRAAKYIRRHRVVAALSAVAVAATVIGFVGILAQVHRAQQERDRAVEQLTYAEAVEDFLTFLLGSTANKPFTVSDLLQNGQQMVEAQFAQDAGLRARLQLVLSNLYSDINAQQRNADLLARARDASRSAGSALLQARVDCAAAQEVGIEQDDRRAQELFRHAIDTLQASSFVDRTALATCYANRATRELELNELDRALVDVRQALSLLAGSHAGVRPLVLRVRTDLAGILARRGELAAALDELQQLERELAALGRGTSEEMRTLLNNRGVLLYRAGQPLQALDAFERARAMEPDASTNPATDGNRAAQLLAVGRRAEALEAFRHALATADTLGDSRARVYLVAAFSACEPGEIASCEARLQEARTQLVQFTPAGHPTFATVEITAARFALARQDVASAKTHLDEALRVLDAAKGLFLQKCVALSLLSRAELQLGDRAAARAHATRAVAYARDNLQGLPHSAWLGYALLADALVLRADGDAAARSRLEQALAELQATVGPDAAETREARALLEAG